MTNIRFLLPVILGVFCVTGMAVPVKSAEPDDEILALKRSSKAFVRISKKITPSVVNIKTYRRVGGRSYDSYDGGFGQMFEPFKEFFGRDFTDRFMGPSDERLMQHGLGSGVIVRKEGIILTNNHVIQGADVIKVTLEDRTELDASVVGSDPRTDIAVLRLPESNYLYAEMGDSDAIEIGEWVIAIGNPFGLGQSVTVGVVSAKGRANVGVADLEDFIQTDAAINPGNSGGPLVDLDGKVVGINTAIFTRSGGYQGVGFAVPSNMAQTILDGLLRTGKIIRSDLGIHVQEANQALLKALGAEGNRGVVVSEVMEDGLAHKAGIRRGDLIVRIKNRVIEEVNTYYRIVSLLPIDEKVPVVIIRDGLPLTIMVQVGELPPRPQESPMRLRTALGFSVEELTEDLAERLGYRYERGVLITRVTRRSQADRAGIEPGDLVVRIDGNITSDLDGFRKHFEAVEWGDRVKLEIKGRERSFEVSLVLRQE
jgi:serine protease Do